MGLQQSRQSIFDAFELGYPIGSGNFGQVLLCTPHDEPGQSYAVKVVDMDSQISKAMEAFKSARAELDIMKRLDHPNIVRLIQVFQDKRFLYVIMERVKGGELFEALKSELALITEQDVARIGLQLFKALEYLHSCRVVHRDIKAQNILLTEPPLLPGRALSKADIKVIDFGLSARLPRECCWRPSDRAFDIVCGTPACCAPEIWATQEGAVPIWKKRFGSRYGAKVDVYAAGVVLYMALLGQLPYHAENSLKLARLVCSKDSFPSFESKDGSHKVSSRCRDFLSRLLEKDPNNRCTAAEAVRHAWLSGRVKRSLPQPIPLQVRSSAAAQAEASLAHCLPECEHHATPKEKSERALALAQAHRDWVQGLELASDSESDSESDS